MEATMKKSTSEMMEILFSLLDEGLDDIENGRVMTLEEAWKEIEEG